MTAADAWVEYATPLAGHDAGRRAAGDRHRIAQPVRGAMTFAGNWLYDTFTTPLSIPATSGTSGLRQHAHAASRQEPVAAALRGARPARQRDDVGRRAGGGRGHRHEPGDGPPIGDLTTAEICSIANFDIAAMSIRGFDYASCADRKMAVVAQPPVPHDQEGQDRRQVQRRREDHRPAARRHGGRRRDLGGDHARLSRPHRVLRPGPARIPRL